jgi:hypothetical protein
MSTEQLAPLARPLESRSSLPLEVDATTVTVSTREGRDWFLTLHILGIASESSCRIVAALGKSTEQAEPAKNEQMPLFFPVARPAERRAVLRGIHAMSLGTLT